MQTLKEFFRLLLIPMERENETFKERLLKMHLTDRFARNFHTNSIQAIGECK